MEQEALEQGLEGLLLSFDEQYPCWTPAMLALAGLDRSAADGLARKGLLEFEKGIYSLSEAGRKTFLRLAGKAWGAWISPLIRWLRSVAMLIISE